MTGWDDSKVAVFPLLKLGIRPKRVILETMPDPKFLGKLDSTLVDGKSGKLNRAAKEYLGFVKHNAQVLFQLEATQKISQLTISFLEDMEQGVFSPETIEVWGGPNKDALTKLGEAKTAFPSEKRASSKGLVQIKFPQQSAGFVRLTAKRFQALPAWYSPQKDTKVSIFLDEVAFE